MLDIDIIIKRLAQIKYLYNIGIQQSTQVDAIAGFSILAFHDCAEMFLLLAAENKNIRVDKLEFMGFWEKLPNLTLRESMKMLKDRRINIKHKGIFPSKFDIESSRATIKNFFEENTPIQFGINFKDVSVSNLIAFDNVKRYINKAETAYERNDSYECLSNCKIAFKELLYSYESNKSKPFSFNNILEIGVEIGTDYKKLVGSETRHGARWFEQVTETTNKIREILKITALGIDYKKYVYFEAITPYVEMWWKDNDREYSVIPRDIYGKGHVLHKTDYKLCINFVIDSALKLQAFDYDINKIFGE